jgi:predicted MFS family arabinose efflux permease
LNPAVARPARAAGGPRWALLFGNFVIGCALMSAAGSLNDMAQSLRVSVALAGQLIAITAATVAVGAPLLAGWVAAFDRRRLLTAALAWCGAGHVVCALMPDYATLWPVRALTMLSAAVFTPQAAAAIGFMTPQQHRGRAITFIFLGWSLASVLGLPLSAWLAENHGWRVAFLAIAALSLPAAAWVWHAMPDGVRPLALSRRAWMDVLTSPLLMAMVGVTALSAAGQFTLFAYVTPYYRQVLGASPEQVSLLLVWFGACGLAGNLLVSRAIDRVGADRAVLVSLALMATSLALWPLAADVFTTALVALPWGLGCFASNSAQQARLSIAAPALAPAVMALNTSAIYIGQALGAGSGGWFIAHGGYGPLSWAALAWMLVAIGASVAVARSARGRS